MPGNSHKYDLEERTLEFAKICEIIAQNST